MTADALLRANLLLVAASTQTAEFVAFNHRAFNHKAFNHKVQQGASRVAAVAAIPETQFGPILRDMALSGFSGLVALPEDHWPDGSLICISSTVGTALAVAAIKQGVANCGV